MKRALFRPSFAVIAAVAQSVERRIGRAEVTGPIPVSSFKILANTGVLRSLLFETPVFCNSPGYRNCYFFAGRAPGGGNAFPLPGAQFEACICI